MGYGQVVGGDFHGSTVTTAPIGGALVVQAGLRWRKLAPEQVAGWLERPADEHPGRVGAIGRAVAGAVAPRMLSKTASAAVGAALDSTIRAPRYVEVDWTDGKRSLIKLPEDLFAHFAMVLRDRRSSDPAPVEHASPNDAALAQESPQSMTQQAFSLVTDIIRDRVPRPTEAAAVSSAAPELGIAEQLKTLAALHAQGILTDEEFAAKRKILIDRL